MAPELGEVCPPAIWREPVDFPDGAGLDEPVFQSRRAWPRVDVPGLTASPHQGFGEPNGAKRYQAGCWTPTVQPQ
jgi:hypothetical protein